MSLFQNHVGVNLTASKIQLVEIVFKQEGFYLENVDEEILDEGFKEELTEKKLISILQNSFNKISSRTKLSSKNLSFTLSNEFFKICELPYDDSLVKKDLLDHFRWEISVLFPTVNKDDIFIQHIEADKSNIRNQKKALILGLNKKLITVLHRFSIKNGFDLKYVDNSHIASNAIIVVEGLSSAHEIIGSLLVEDNNKCSLMILDGNYPVYFKYNEDSGLPLIDYLKKELTAIRESGKINGTVKKLFLFGSNLTDPFLNDLRSNFSLAIVRCNPFTKLRVNESMEKNNYYKRQYFSFSASTGIALRII